MSGDTTVEIPDSASSIREDLVQTAVNFLKNPKIINIPLAKKQNFLTRKGLSDEEIRRACEIAGAYAQYEQQVQIPPPLPPPALVGVNTQVTFFSKLKEIVHSLAIFSIVGYAIYKFYEKFIAPFLFGKKKKSVEDSLEEMNSDIKKQIQEMNQNLQSMRIEVDRLNDFSEGSPYRKLSELKSEVATVKGLLLNRKQFPSVSNSPVVPPSIPAWQMASVTTADSDEHDGDTDHKTEELEEIASASGSSEPEHCTKTSESSLEILCLPKDSDSEK